MATTFAVPDGRVAMAATTYTGTGATQTISNAVNTVSFQPDLVWIKSRSTAGSNILQDSVRGATIALFSDATTADTTLVNGLTAFASNGFTLGSGAATNQNTSATTYIGWNWKAGGTAVSNTAGTITSSVSANTTAGFSVVTYTTAGANATVGHGLGVAPSLIIVKSRAIVLSWLVYHASIGNTKYLLLNTTAAEAVDSTAWNNTSPTASVFTSGTAFGSNTYVAYCWAPVAGYSAFGSYTGNGSADGPFIYTGFRPRWLMIKRTDATLSWGIFDTSRNAFNVVDLQLYANLSVADNVFTTMDILSNGFKSRSATEYNTSGGTYIYAAFAENPLKFSNAR
jgi:hypothetical protein